MRRHGTGLFNQTVETVFFELLGVIHSDWANFDQFSPFLASITVKKYIWSNDP